MSKVYFADFTAAFGDDLLGKFERLFVVAGIDKIDFEGKFAAIKIHFGEWGNMAFLRHQYAEVLADYIKEKGGKVFLTDANTLYAGYRGNAVDHLYNAAWNGYTQAVVGCPVIIADGLRGTDERIIKLDNAEYCKEPKIAAAVAEADIIISLTHAKGHEAAGFGGALKNLGMGSGSKKGKMEMHNSGIPFVKEKHCVGCGNCCSACGNDALHLVNHKAEIDESKCLGCGNCIAYCYKDAIACKWDEANDVLNKKIAEYALAVVKGKPQFHISLACDIQQNCDCGGGRTVQLVPDIGMFASFDAVALDQAVADKIMEAPLMPGCRLEDSCCHEHEDKLRMVHPETNWVVQLEHGEKIGIGERKYELITVK